MSAILFVVLVVAGTRAPIFAINLSRDLNLSSASLLLLLITLAGATLGLVRRESKTAKLIAFVLVSVSAVLTYVDGNRIEARVSNSTRYVGVARLGINGYYTQLGEFFDTTDPLYTKLLGTYEYRDGGAFFYCTQEAQSVYAEVIAAYPDFPLAYYELSFCMKRDGNQQWRTYAERGARILRETVQVGGHAPEHDAALTVLEGYLAESN